MARTKLDLGGMTATLAMPMRPKGSGVWSVDARPVRYFPEIGETADDAAAFASAIGASYATWRRAEDARRDEPSRGYDASRAPVGRADVVTDAERKSIAAWHTAQAAAVPARGSSRLPAPDASLAAAFVAFVGRDRAESRASVQRFAARIRAERAAAAAEIEIARVARLLATSGPTDAEITAAAEPYHAPTMRHAIDIAPADALTVCNACEVRPMVGSEHPGYAAGYCADCYAEATAPEPEPEPAPFALPEPVAPADALAPEGPEAEPWQPSPAYVAEYVYGGPDSEAPVTADVGVRRYGRRWRAYELESGGNIGPEHRTRREAVAYAAERQATTYTASESEPAPADVVQVRVDGVTVATTRHVELSAPAPEPTDDMIGREAVMAADWQPEPYAWMRPDIGTPEERAEVEAQYLAEQLAARESTPEPVAAPAPVLTVVQPRERPTCPRCGQTFRRSGAGYAWHVANRPDCAAARLAVVA